MLQITYGNAGPHWLEMVNWGSQILLVLVAAITLSLGYLQLREAAHARRAALLLELDTRFDSEAMRQARKAMSDLKELTTTLVSQNHPLANDHARMELLRGETCDQLQSMRTGSEEQYLKLLGLLGFFETVGMMVKKDYIAQADVIDLFKGPIIDLDNVFRDHISARGNEIGVPKGLFEHAFYLCDLAKSGA